MKLFDPYEYDGLQRLSKLNLVAAVAVLLLSLVPALRFLFAAFWMFCVVSVLLTAVDMVLAVRVWGRRK
jgi:hypothetical protein